MKKFSLLIFLFGGLILTGCKRKTTEEKMQYTVEKFVEYVKTNKLDSASMIYPTCNFYKGIDIGEVTVLNVKKDPIFDNTYVVTCNNAMQDESYNMVNRPLTFWLNPSNNKKENIQIINKTKGLIDLPSPYKAFLTKAGALKDYLTDGEVVFEMSAYLDFIKYYMQKYQVNIDQLSVANYSGNEYNAYLFEHPHANASIRLN